MNDPVLISQRNHGIPPPSIASRGVGILMGVSIAFFLIVLAMWGGVFFYERSLKETLDGRTRELKRLEAALDPEIIREIVRVDNGLAMARALLGAHVYSTNVFKFLQEQTLRTVQYKSFTYSSDGARVTVAGDADGYISLHQQLERLRSTPLVTNVAFTTVSIGEGGRIGFSFDITFNRTLLQFGRQ